MRALLAAIRCPKGDIEQDLAAHLGPLAEAKAGRCELALFPEVSLTGPADPAAHPERLIGLDHPAVAALAGPDGGVTARPPDWRPGGLPADIPC